MAIGRPPKEIDWERLDKLLVAGCLGTEIAAYFDVHPETLYNKVHDRSGMLFSDYMVKRKEHGNALLREAQYEKALDKDNTMMIWLGKNRLNQSDLVKEEVQKVVSDKLDAMLEQFKQAQGFVLKIDDSKIIKEQ